jgi:hypothetical protein
MLCIFYESQSERRPSEQPASSVPPLAGHLLLPHPPFGHLLQRRREAEIVSLRRETEIVSLRRKQHLSWIKKRNKKEGIRELF